MSEHIPCYSCEFTELGRRCPTCLRIRPFADAAERFQRFIEAIDRVRQIAEGCSCGFCFHCAPSECEEDPVRKPEDSE